MDNPIFWAIAFLRCCSRSCAVVELIMLIVVSQHHGRLRGHHIDDNGWRHHYDQGYHDYGRKRFHVRF